MQQHHSRTGRVDGLSSKLTEVVEGQVSDATSPDVLVTCRHASWGSPSFRGPPAGHFPCGRMYMRVAQAAYVTHRKCNLHNTETRSDWQIYRRPVTREAAIFGYVYYMTNGKLRTQHNAEKRTQFSRSFST